MNTRGFILTHTLAVAASTAFYVTQMYTFLLVVIAITLVGALFQRGIPEMEKLQTAIFIAGLAVFIGFFVASTIVGQTKYKPPGSTDPITELAFTFPFITVPAGAIALFFGSTLQARKRS